MLFDDVMVKKGIGPESIQERLFTVRPTIAGAGMRNLFLPVI
jgi:hypothetical protein